MSKINLMGLTLDQMQAALLALGENRYRGRQLFKWLYQARQHDFDRMTDLSRELRRQLAERYTVEGLTMVRKQRSKDGTEKFLFRLADRHPIETVLIPDRDRRTVCVSSQAGCALACKFCATGTMGLLRDLTVGEIVGQLVFLRQMYGDDSFGHVVFMGMGEPLNNYENLLESLRIMTSSQGLAIPARRITVSTSGITPKIKKLAESGLKVRLAVSLHAATQVKRLKIMPVADTFKLTKLMEAVRYYTEVTNQPVTFEYIVMAGFNDTMADIKALGRLVGGIPCKINLLAYNPVPGLPFKRPADEVVDWFGRELNPRVMAVTVRQSRGRDIEAACGQLAARSLT
ncbi:MAG: 23S rRNA (adenine(2503)-C(2))-methyltransferase RlmN [candidate division Zixibacteria bacterium]|nr:23S rRNA (adenine(2503)-C(2))-methyltransferase RlmN [candidate division Zixibacteria bacterium]